MYEAVIDGKVTEEDRQAFAEGLDIGDDKPTLPAELTILETTEREPGILKAGSALPSVRAASTRSSACLRRSENGRLFETAVDGEPGT